MPTDTDTDTEAGVLEAIDAIRPALQSDGGDIVFNEIDARRRRARRRWSGACGTCPVSMMTLKAGVERIIMDRGPGDHRGRSPTIATRSTIRPRVGRRAPVAATGRRRQADLAGRGGR